MCGRNSLFADQGYLEERFDAEMALGGEYTPRYNIAPGQELDVITNEASATISRFHWGLIPFWADAPEDGLINARSETADEKRVFQNAWESRPCLVLSSGFYEWADGDAGPKQPYRVYHSEEPAFAMAGLWETWDGEETIDCVTILTTEPNSLMEPIHDRMPVVLPKDSESDWLSSSEERRRQVCRPYQGNDLTADPISTKVNDPTNESPELIEPLGHEQAGFDDF